MSCSRISSGVICYLVLFAVAEAVSIFFFLKYNTKFTDAKNTLSDNPSCGVGSCDVNPIDVACASDCNDYTSNSKNAAGLMMSMAITGVGIVITSLMIVYDLFYRDRDRAAASQVGMFANSRGNDLPADAPARVAIDMTHKSAI